MIDASIRRNLCSTGVVEADFRFTRSGKCRCCEREVNGIMSDSKDVNSNSAKLVAVAVAKLVLEKLFSRAQMCGSRNRLGRGNKGGGLYSSECAVMRQGIR